MARTADRPHDPFAPPIPAFPTNRLRSAGLSDARLANLADRFDEMSTENARRFVNRVRTHPTRELADLFAPPVGDDIEAIADEPRDRLVWLAASYGQPISGNRHDLARLIVLGRDIEAASDALTATVDASAYPDPDDLAAARDAVVPNQADDEDDEAYLTRLRAALPEAPPAETPDAPAEGGQEAPVEGEGTTDTPQGDGEASTGDQGDQETDAADDPTEVSDAPAEGTDPVVTETPETTTPGETTTPVEGDAPAPVDGDAPIAVEGDTVTAVTGDASPEATTTMAAAAATDQADAPAPAKSRRTRKATT